MRQLFRVTAADFAPKEPTIDDAVMNEDDIVLFDAMVAAVKAYAARKRAKKDL